MFVEPQLLRRPRLAIERTRLLILLYCIRVAVGGRQAFSGDSIIGSTPVCRASMDRQLFWEIPDNS